MDILNKNMETLNKQNNLNRETMISIVTRLDKLEGKKSEPVKIRSKGDSSMTPVKPQKKGVIKINVAEAEPESSESEEEPEVEQTDEDLVISMAKKKASKKSPM